MEKRIENFGRENEFAGRLQYIDIRGKQVKDLSDLASLLKDWRNPQTEYFHIVYTNKSGKVLAHTAITSDEVNLVEIPQNEILYKIAQRGKRLKAFKIYAAHNHPSGNPDPSYADINITPRLFEHIKSFEGHIVLDHDCFCSISKEGKIKKHEVNLGKSYQATNIEVSSSGIAAKIFDAHYQNEEGKIGVLVLNSESKPIALEKMRYAPESFQQTLKEAVRKHHGSNAIIGTGDNVKDAIVNMIKDDPMVLDVLAAVGGKNGFKKVEIDERMIYGSEDDSFDTRRVFEPLIKYQSVINQRNDKDYKGKDFIQLKSGTENQRLTELMKIRKMNDERNKEKNINHNR